MKYASQGRVPVLGVPFSPRLFKEASPHALVSTPSSAARVPKVSKVPNLLFFTHLPFVTKCSEQDGVASIQIIPGHC
jgi:hypothetical protein